MRTAVRFAFLAALLPVAAALLLAGSPNSAHADDPGEEHLPDIRTLPMTQIHLEGTFLRFDNSVANYGDGPFELFSQDDGGAGEDRNAFQRIFTHDNSQPWVWSVAREQEVGKLVFHDLHNHWHFDDFATYKLHAKTKEGGIGEVIVDGGKVSFCMLNSGVFNSGFEHFDLSIDGDNFPDYFSCDVDGRWGISVGAYDLYNYFLPDQYVNVAGVAAGDYWLVSTADPSNRIVETDDTNNVTAVEVTLPDMTTPSPSPVPSHTATPTPTPTATAAPTSEPTLTPTPTPTATATQPPTDDPAPTDTPEPTPTATPTPEPTSEPTPSLAPAGSTDCDSDVDSLDGLWVLRNVAGLPNPIECMDKGDVNCDAELEALDAQLILRHVAGLPVDLPTGCPAIGSLS